MTNDELKRAVASIEELEREAASKAGRPMTLRERLAAARDAIAECGHAVYGALRGWRLLND